MQLGEFALIPPGTEAEIVRYCKHRVEAIAIPYAKLMVLSGDDSGLPPDGDFGAMHSRSNVSPAVIRLSAALLRGARSSEPYGQLAADGRILQLVAALLELRDGQPARAVGGLSPSQLRRCLEALAQETPLRISLLELAKLTGQSASHVSRAFKVSTGTTPHAWAMQHRLECAKVALTGSAKVAQIAADCGFASQQHFTTAFKKATGATPAAWRREWQR
jgi:AraC-like DNA-binding protein